MPASRWRSPCSGGCASCSSKWLDLGSEKPFQLRIEVNTGFSAVGNFGSEDRMDYTIIGNEVNLATRLQSHAELGEILLEKDGRIIREQREGFWLLVDLTKGDEASAIAAVENVLARLKGSSACGGSAFKYVAV